MPDRRARAVLALAALRRGLLTVLSRYEWPCKRRERRDNGADNSDPLRGHPLQGPDPGRTAGQDERDSPSFVASGASACCDKQCRPSCLTLVPESHDPGSVHCAAMHNRGRPVEQLPNCAIGQLLNYPRSVKTSVKSKSTLCKLNRPWMGLDQSRMATKWTPRIPPASCRGHCSDSVESAFHRLQEFVVQCV